MIDFRYHLVSIIAVFFALAVGIVLGAGPLKQGVDDTLTSQISELRSEAERLRTELNAANAAREYDEAFSAEVAPSLISNQLTGTNVLLVSLPEADGDVVSAVRDQLTAAGANAEYGIEINESWTTSDSENVLDDLAAQHVSDQDMLDADANGYRRGAMVLADALLTNETNSGDTVDTDTVSAYEEQGLLTVNGEAGNAPTQVVLVAGELPEEGTEQAAAIQAGFTGAFGEVSAGSVLTGGPPTATEPGVLAAVRGDGELRENTSTVDVATSTSGRIAVVYAVVEQRAGGQGAYGIGPDVDAAVPEVASTSTGNTDDGGPTGDAETSGDGAGNDGG